MFVLGYCSAMSGTVSIRAAVALNVQIKPAIAATTALVALFATMEME